MEHLEESRETLSRVAAETRDRGAETELLLRRFSSVQKSIVGGGLLPWPDFPRNFLVFVSPFTIIRFV